jgi:Protein of unknown function (DUF3396)
MASAQVSTLRETQGGQLLCSVTPALTMYLKEPPDGAQALNALSVYREVCPSERQKFVAGTRSPGFAKLPDTVGQKVLSSLLDLMNRRKDIGVSMWDGNTGESWSFAISGVPIAGYPPMASYCQVFFPNSVEPALILQTALRLADALPFQSGHAGLSASFDSDQKYDAFNIIYGWAKNYPGLEVEDLNETLPYVLDAVKGANWLTLVGNELWGKLVSLRGSEPLLSEQIEFIQKKNGVVLRAGEAPALGRRNAGDVPLLYVEVERAIAELKVKTHGEFAARFAEREETLQWVYRFLRPEDW